MHGLELTDMDSAPLETLNFGVVQIGGVSNIHSFKVTNTGTDKITSLSIKPVTSYFQSGGFDETIDSTFISLDGLVYHKNLTINLNSNETKIIYIKWQPMWISRQEEAAWDLEFEIKG